MRRAIRRYCLSGGRCEPGRGPRPVVGRLHRGGVWRDASLVALGTRLLVPPGPRPPTEGGSAGEPAEVRSHVLGWCCGNWPGGPVPGRAERVRSALPLLVPRVLADDHHTTVPADDLALVADPLDARLDLHGAHSWFDSALARTRRPGADGGGDGGRPTRGPRALRTSPSTPTGDPFPDTPARITDSGDQGVTVRAPSARLKSGAGQSRRGRHDPDRAHLWR